MTALKKFSFFILTLIFSLTTSYAINISTCGTLTTSNEIYTLNDSLTMSGAGDCLLVQASNITLNCQGFFIQGNGSDDSRGINLDSGSNATVENCKIRLLEAGIYIQSSQNTINNNSIYNTSEQAGGIYVLEENNTISNNYMHNLSYTGIFISSSATNTTATGNTINLSNYHGIRIFSQHSTLTKNKIIDTRHSGIYISGEYNTLSYNNISKVSGNGYGIDLEGGSNNSFSNFHLMFQKIAVHLRGGSHNNSFTDVSIFNGSQSASNRGHISLRVGPNTKNSFTNIYIEDNSTSQAISGIKIEGDSNNTFSNITTKNNPYNGIYLLGSSNNNTFINITVINSTNAAFDIENSSFNTFNTFTITNLSGSFEEAIELENSSNNTFTFGKFLNNLVNDIHFNTNSIYNSFYFNNFTSASNILAVGSNNYFDNSSHGNWWGDFTCYDSSRIGNYFVCNDPANYTVNQSNSVYDLKPLTDKFYVGSCRNITESGYHYLSRDLNSSGTCINILVDDVNLNCDYHLLTGNGSGDGIYNYDETNITIRNCEIKNFNNGIHLSSQFTSGNDAYVFNVTLHNNSNVGIQSSKVDIRLTNATLFNNIDGAYIDRSKSGYISNSIAHNNSVRGLSFSNSDNMNITNITVYNNSEIGIRISLGDYLVINNITSYDNDNNGIEIVNSDYNTFNNIYSYRNVLSGIYFTGSKHSSFNQIHTHNNSNDGFELDSSSNYNNISYLYSNDNFDDALVFRSVSSFNIVHNSVLGYNESSSTSESLNFNSPVALNNTFYLNQFGPLSRVRILNFSNIFTYNISGIGQIGNWWQDLTCASYENRGPYIVCTDPSNYTINSTYNTTDFAPLFDGPFYVYPTPLDESNYGGTSFTVRIHDPQQIVQSPVLVEINGSSFSKLNYSMTNTSSIYWEYTFTNVPNSVTKITFKVYYNSTKNNQILQLGERTFTFYPLDSYGLIPGFGLGSLVTSILIIIGGFILNRKWF